MNADIARRLVHFRSNHEPALLNRNNNPMDYLIDTRGAMSDVEAREAILSALLKLLLGGAFTSVCGIAKSGMIWGAVAADRLGLPYATVLPDGPRGSGLNRQIEGVLPPGHCAVIDNWIISGKSAKQAIDVVASQNGVEATLVLLMRPPSIPNVDFPIQAVFDAEYVVSLARQDSEAQQISP